MGLAKYCARARLLEDKLLVSLEQIMGTHVARHCIAPEIYEPPGIQPHEDRREDTRLPLPWRIKIEPESGMRFSADVGDISIRVFQIECHEMLDLGTKVQFSVTEHTDEYLDGKALKGEAIVSAIHRKSTVFKFEAFSGDNYDRLCDALLRYIHGVS